MSISHPATSPRALYNTHHDRALERPELLYRPLQRSSGHGRHQSGLERIANHQHRRCDQQRAKRHHRRLPGAPSPSADGTAYYDTSSLSTSASSSTPIESTTSSVTQNGTITAGIYHELNIVIPDAQNSGIYTDATPIQVNPTDNAQFGLYRRRSTRASARRARTRIFGSQDDATAFDKDTSTSPVGALSFGPLYAAGGIVTVNADKLTGDGSITAYGGPTISITNASPDYLVFDTITIPFLPGGEVLFTGAAGQTAATKAGITRHADQDQGAGSVVTINENYPSAVGTSSTSPGPGPAVYLNGDINNLGGQVAITNVDGSVATLATINAEQVNITAPNGILVISPASGLEITGSAPYDEWANRDGVAGWEPPRRHDPAQRKPGRRLRGQRGVQPEAERT